MEESYAQECKLDSNDLTEYVIVNEDDIFEMNMDMIMQTNVDLRKNQVKNVKGVSYGFFAGTGIGLYFGVLPGLITGWTSYAAYVYL